MKFDPNEPASTLGELHSFRMWCGACRQGIQWFFACDPMEAKCAVETFILRHAKCPPGSIAVAERATGTVEIAERLVISKAHALRDHYKGEEWGLLQEIQDLLLAVDDLRKLEELSKEPAP